MSRQPQVSRQDEFCDPKDVMAEPEPIPFQHIVVLPHHRTGTMNTTQYPAAESFVRYTAESLLPNNEERRARSEVSDALERHPPFPSGRGQGGMFEDEPCAGTTPPPLSPMEDFSSSSSGSEDGDADSASEEASTKTGATMSKVKADDGTDNGDSSANEADDSDLDYRDGPFRRPANTSSKKAVKRSSSNAAATTATPATNNTPRSRHKRNKRNDRFEARLSAVNGVVTPSKLAAGQAPIPGKGGSAANVVRDRHCPICLVAYARDAHVRSHFAACVERNGNPQGVFWNSHPSVRTED